MLNLDDEAGRWYQGVDRLPLLTYSENKDTADLTAKSIRLFPGHVEFEAVARGQITRVHLPHPRRLYHLQRPGGAWHAGSAWTSRWTRRPPPPACGAGVKGRVEVVPVPTAYTVIIDYAHTPDALENILTTARDFTAGRLICVFGCGGRTGASAPLMGAVAAELADLVVVTSDNPRTEGRRISSRISCRAWGMDTSATWSPTVRRPSAGPCPRRARGRGRAGWKGA